MSRRFLGTLTIALLALLVFPSVGHASIWDLIWSMSGPRMSSVFILHCEQDWEGNAGKTEMPADFQARTNGTIPEGMQLAPWTRTECRVYDYRFSGYLRSRARRTAWLSVDTILFTSITHQSGLFTYDGWDHTMLVVEPLFEVRSYAKGDLMFNHGVIGASYQILAGDDYGTFDKFAIKFRPVIVTYKRVNGSFTMRWYPHGFTPDEFGVVEPRLNDVDRPSEMVWGFSLGFLFDQPKFIKK